MPNLTTSATLMYVVYDYKSHKPNLHDCNNCEMFYHNCVFYVFDYRSQWDQYLSPYGTPVPSVWVESDLPTNDQWARYLK